MFCFYCFATQSRESKRAEIESPAFFSLEGDSKKERMSCQIQFKTAFNNNYDKITFDGDCLPLAQIKLLIIEKSKFNKSIEFDLEITNADTNEGKSKTFFLFFFIIYSYKLRLKPWCPPVHKTFLNTPINFLGI